MKKILIGLGVVLVLVAGGVLYLWQTLGSRVHAAVEEVGSRTTGVPVTLKKAGQAVEAAVQIVSVGRLVR